MLNLRYKPNCSKQLPSAVGLGDLRDRIGVMRRQEETTYKCNDYILNRRTEQRKVKKKPCSSLPRTDAVDEKCRERMVEWAYRIVDHFHGDRDIVAASFSYLDRFLDRCNCDRTAYKLAAITTLYIATKTFSPKHISMRSLADLSRGEFDAENIAEMEGIILRTLEWRMHPPTCKTFIDHLLCLLPTVSDEIRMVISQRAHFFAELSILDYSFTCEDPSSVALAAILNAAMGFQYCNMVQDALAQFQCTLKEITGMDCEAHGTSVLQERLWNLYCLSEQFKLHDTVLVMPSEEQRSSSVIDKSADGDRDQSPVSVSFETNCSLRNQH